MVVIEFITHLYVRQTRTTEIGFSMPLTLTVVGFVALHTTMGMLPFFPFRQVTAEAAEPFALFQILTLHRTLLWPHSCSSRHKAIF